jgi:HNH endonuclease
MELTQEYLRTAIHYDPETGSFIWNHRPREHFANEDTYKKWNSRHYGTVAGFRRFDGYTIIGVNKKQYRAHRLAFLYMTGNIPLFDTDHINGMRSDNRWENLRSVDRVENSRNMGMRGTNTSGACGVEKHQGKWRARIMVNGKNVHIGCYDNFLVAVGKRKAAEIKYGFHENHGRR